MKKENINITESNNLMIIIVFMVRIALRFSTNKI